MLFFSYQPLFSLGSGAYKTHYEFSLIELYLILFVILNLRAIWRKRRDIIKNDAVKLLLAFGAYNTVSLAWTPDLARGALTAGVVWMLIFTVFAFISNSHLKTLAKPLARTLIISSLLISVFAWYQFITGSFTNQSSVTLLCEGCKATQFGFVRPNAFAIEPQFLGNLLLAPILLLVHFVVTKKRSASVYIALGALLFTMVLTLSRGAIVALVAGLVVLFIVDRKLYKRFIIPIGIGGLSIVGGILAQGITAQLNPTVSVSFTQAIAASINQLSMGKISLGQEQTSTSVSSGSTSKTTPVSFTGYVARSTNERLDSSCLAVDIWMTTPARAMFGVGLAGTGYHFANTPIRSNAPWCKTNI